MLLIINSWIKIALLGIMLWCFTLVIVIIPPPALAATSTENFAPYNSDRPILTLDILQQRIASPIASDGVKTIDLGQFCIDLSPENEEFRTQFYHLLQTQLNRVGGAVALDLSDSIIQGDFAGNELGLRAPLYGDALFPLFSEKEKEQLKRDRSRLSRLSQLSRSLLGTAPEQVQISVFQEPIKLVQTHFRGAVNFNNTFFLKPIEVTGAKFEKDADWSETRFSQPVSFTSATFAGEAGFRGAIFFEKAGFNQVQFQAFANFQSSQFQETGNFNQTEFKQASNFTRSLWDGNADFSGTQWLEQALFDRGKFTKFLFLTETKFRNLASFREARFSKPINLRDASIRDRLAFSDATFGKDTYINLAGFSFDSEEAKITGDPGQIGRKLSITTLRGNETLLRQLVRNFRQQEQIADANQIEYMTEQLRQKDLRQRLFGININTASIRQLIKLGLSANQAKAIARSQGDRVFGSLSELLSLPEIDLASYIKVRDRAIADEPLSLGGWLRTALHWLGLSVLLLLSRYGTSFWLVFGVGLVAIAYFSVLFWFVDRYRRTLPKPILPTPFETGWMIGSFIVLAGAGMLAIFRTSSQPGLTLAYLGILTVPVPAILLCVLYKRGRYHNLMDVSYFVEDASMRQLRLMIGRLPLMPRFEFFRDRHLPILCDRRWNWLNYYDFSLNNLLKFGFNDIRLRDQHLPGIITSLVWYQWSLGILYIILLLWTLSRTIPGLNLLIYLK